MDQAVEGPRGDAWLLRTGETIARAPVGPGAGRPEALGRIPGLDRLRPAGRRRGAGAGGRGGRRGRAAGAGGGWPAGAAGRGAARRGARHHGGRRGGREGSHLGGARGR
ncbi:MAG: hypothetical protein R3F43_05630 [bacterium]